MPKIIVITGPESTGKSTLCMQLSEIFKAEAVPEYARCYVEKLQRPYAYYDLTEIARRQIKQFNKAEKSRQPFVFFDTGLEITKVWFEEVYRKVPAFVNDFVKNQPADYYLLCQTDLEWKYDKTRENKGQKREYLYRRYKTILQENHCRFTEINGRGEKRTANAKNILASAYDLQNL